MKVETTQDSAGTVIRVEGEVDLKTSSGMREAVQAVFRGKPKAIFIDIAAVPYMDSSGVATLVEAFGLAGRAKIPFGLIAPTPRVSDILSLAHLNDIFPIHATLAAARLDAARAGGPASPAGNPHDVA